MTSLNIKSTDSFKKANKKTSAVALDNLPTPINDGRDVQRRNLLIDEQKIEDALYDIPGNYRLKQQPKEEEREL